MHKRKDSDLIMSIRGALELRQYRTEESINQLRLYRSCLQKRFDHDRHRSKLTMADFFGHEIGQCWQCSGSCLFMLSGCNEAGTSLMVESWLSPLAVDLIRTLLDDGRLVAFEVCDSTSTVESTMSRLIVQLLEKRPASVRKVEDAENLQHLVSYLEDEREKGLSDALLRIVSLQKEPIFFVLDRPDRSEEDSVTAYASAMLRLVEQASCDLKVLLVQRAEMWSFEENKKGILTRDSKPDMLRALRIDQHRL